MIHREQPVPVIYDFTVYRNTRKQKGKKFSMVSPELFQYPVFENKKQEQKFLKRHGEEDIPVEKFWKSFSKYLSMR